MNSKEKESDELLCTVRSLVMVRSQLPARGAKGKKRSFPASNRARSLSLNYSPRKSRQRPEWIVISCINAIAAIDVTEHCLSLWRRLSRSN